MTVFRRPVPARARRAGFTPTELLVVIAIIGVLASLVVVAAWPMINVRRQKNTEQTLQVVNKVLQQQWKFVIDDAKKETPSSAAFSLAGGATDRARVIWTYARLVEAFPMTFGEIDVQNNPMYTTLPPPINAPLIPTSAPRKNIATYRKALAAKTGTTDPTTEAGAALYLALRTKRGNLSALTDDKAFFKDTDGDGLPEIADGFNKAVGFYRFGWNNQAVLDVIPPSVLTSPKTAKYRNRLDPGGTLADPLWYYVQPLGTPPVKSPNAKLFEGLFHQILDGSGTNENYVIPAVVSAGRDGVFDLNPDLSAAGPGEADNVYNFKVKAD